MTNNQIDTILKFYAEAFSMPQAIPFPAISNDRYDFKDFLEELKKQGENRGILIIQNAVPPEQLRHVLRGNDLPMVFFTQQNGQIFPVIDGRNFKKRQDYQLLIDARGDTREVNTPPYEVENEVVLLTAFPLESIAEENQPESSEPLTPVQRLVRMLRTERKDIISIYVYALLIGAISLVLPLGIQAIIGLVQGGLVFSSIYLLIGGVVVALIISGVMQIMQLTLVEYLQERLFSKAAFDFTFRIPRVKAEALMKYYPPELLNRFFDIVTVQKSLPKLLIDITAALIQIIFGLILLAAYHPLFIGLAVLMTLVIYGVIALYSKSTLEANNLKSKYKYKIAQWLQDVARLHITFKVSGSSRFPMEKMEGLVNGYLKYRDKYFSYLLVYFYYAVFFKAFITGVLLVLGTYLVVERQITIGQFVASEIVVVLVVGSIEKILLSIDSVFDLLTAVDKLGQVADLPLESNNGIVKHLKFSERPIDLSVKNLTYKYEDLSEPTLNNLNLKVNSHQHTCIAGVNGSGKETLLNVLAGIYTSYSGGIVFNGISLRDIERDHLHETIERNVTSEGIFDGTLLENITMKRYNLTMEDVYWVLEKLDLLEQIGSLPDGLSTQMISGGSRFSKSFITKITLARCIINRPKLLMLSDCYENLDRGYILKLLDFVAAPDTPWTLITVSNDPMVMEHCTKIAVLDKGRFIKEGSYAEMKDDSDLLRCIA